MPSHRLLTRARMAVAFLLFAAPASADSMSGTRFDLNERSHVVEVRVDRGVATFVVTRTVENPGPKSDQATFAISVPQGGVATRLRSLSVARNGTRQWFEADLMEAEDAAEKYRELTGIGGYFPKDPALLSWRSIDELALQVFPVLGRSQKTIEYTLKVPLEYTNGHYEHRFTPDGHPTFRFVTVHPEDRISVNGVQVSPSSVVEAASEIQITLEPKRVPLIDASLASFRFADERHLVHARIALAPKLSAVPANANVVILLDTSRSMDDSLPASLGAARAYLASFPGASVEVLTFARHVASAFGGPLEAREALARLYTFAPTTANGSEVAIAIQEADNLLARKPSGPRRILLLTDLLTRASLTANGVASLPLRSGALVHIATVAEGSASLIRDDDSPWARLPRQTGGLLWQAYASERFDGGDTNIFDEWVRPKRVDKFVVKGLPADFVTDSTLAEGDGIEHLAVATSAVERVSIEGELWSRRVQWSGTPIDAENRSWAALVFGTDTQFKLSESEQMTLAKYGHAVSPVTSLLAVEPGVRPSIEGLDYGSAGGGSGGRFGTAGASTTSRCYGGSASNVSQEAFLTAALNKAATACFVSSSVSAVVESTRIEIVDVRATTISPVRDAKAEACITEKLWSVMLPGEFTREHETWNVQSPKR